MGRLGASPKKSLYLQIGIEPGQLIAVARREAVDQVLGVGEVGKAVNGVIWAGVVPAHLVLHHGIHAHGILPVTSGMEGAVAWVWRTRGVEGKWMGSGGREGAHTHIHTHTNVRGSILNGQLTTAQPQTHKTRLNWKLAFSMNTVHTELRGLLDVWLSRMKMVLLSCPASIQSNCTVNSES